jgi:hypothetical protein
MQIMEIFGGSTNKFIKTTGRKSPEPSPLTVETFGCENVFFKRRFFRIVFF